MRPSAVVHNRLALYRAARGLSRKALAEAVHVHPQTIGFLERGDYTPSVELCLRLARVLDVRIDALFSLDPFPLLTDELGTRDPASRPGP